jgi:hypothetical protein
LDEIFDRGDDFIAIWILEDPHAAIGDISKGNGI